jgi:hypothetical protein
MTWAHSIGRSRPARCRRRTLRSAENAFRRSSDSSHEDQLADRPRTLSGVRGDTRYSNGRYGPLWSGGQTVTPPTSKTPCVLCKRPATVEIEPPRRTLARGLDPSDQSFSVTVILPDVLLCGEHAVQVRHGDTHIGWCDDERCRSYGEVGETSICGDQYKRLVPGNRPRSASSHHPSTKHPEI